MVAADGAFEGHWPWASAGAAQLGWGVASMKRGYAGHHSILPFKAFAVASLFVGAAASAVATLQFSGIRSVEDLKNAGANIQNSSSHGRARDESFTSCNE